MGLLSSRPKQFIKKPADGWDSRLWASRVPFKHPENFFEVFRAVWENKDALGYAYRILEDGVCDGCALGTSGMTDWTVEGIHLCNIRLRLLRLNTMPAFADNVPKDISRLKAFSSQELRDLGRIPYPLVRHKGELGFKRVTWSEALTLIAKRIKSTAPDRTYTYLTSRGVPNETYYAVQKAVRAMGSNNIDNAARICHSPSTFALKASLGVAATTCSYTDMIGTDVITFIGSNPAKNQPLVMKYLYHARKAGTRVVLINPYFEPGMDAYWVPSDLESAMFGTKITDDYYQIKASGDRAFLMGTLKAMIEAGWCHETFIQTHTAGFDELKRQLAATSWDTLSHDCGVPVASMQAYAQTLAGADKAIFVWGMGITQHTSGEENVQAIINLALAKGFVGREGCGLMPIRGHSGVQGGAEMGAYANVLPGGVSLTYDTAARLSKQYGFEVPVTKAYTTPEMLMAAARHDIDVLIAIGGNFREVMPDPDGVAAALSSIPLRVHYDITLSSQMLLDPAETVVILPATTRYEVPGGVTETSTERRVIFSPEIPGPRVAEARPEWQVMGELAALVVPQLREKVVFDSTATIRQEIAAVIPWYRGIEQLSKKGDSIQYGGARLCQDWVFPTGDGKAHFGSVALSDEAESAATFRIMTRRGKQFNSMVHASRDVMTGASRDAIMLTEADARRLGLKEGARARLITEFGRFEGTVTIVNIARGCIQVHWPEGNVLLDPQARSPLADIPAYKAVTGRLESA
jgi:molybdopterin-dependent oxidoreductase alpha subunit